MNNLNPDWKLLYVSLSELCDNDFNMTLKVILGSESQLSNIKHDMACTYQSIYGFNRNPFQIDVWDEDKSSRNDLIGSVQVINPFQPKQQSNKVERS